MVYLGIDPSGSKTTVLQTVLAPYESTKPDFQNNNMMNSYYSPQSKGKCELMVNVKSAKQGEHRLLFSGSGVPLPKNFWK